MTKRERYRIAEVIARAPASVLALALGRSTPTPGPGVGQSNGRTRYAGELPTARKRTGAAGDRGAVVPRSAIAQSRRSERFAPEGGRAR